MLQKVNIAVEATRLLEPFALVELAHVDDISVSLFSCQGSVAWHKHLDQDELFLVQNGIITLESDWGTMNLHPDDLVVVPKGVGHRTFSLLWSIAVLMHARIMPDRKNGDRRLFAPRGTGSLNKVNVRKLFRHLRDPTTPVEVARIEDAVLRLGLCLGKTPWHRHPSHDELAFVQQGQVTLDAALDTEAETITLEAGELVVVPRGAIHRLTAARRAAVLFLHHEEVSFAGAA